MTYIFIILLVITKNLNQSASFQGIDELLHISVIVGFVQCFRVILEKTVVELYHRRLRAIVGFQRDGTIIRLAFQQGENILFRRSVLHPVIIRQMVEKFHITVAEPVDGLFHIAKKDDIPVFTQRFHNQRL